MFVYMCIYVCVCVFFRETELEKGAEQFIFDIITAASSCVVGWRERVVLFCRRGHHYIGRNSAYSTRAGRCPGANLLNQPLLHLDADAPPHGPDHLPADVDPPLAAAVHDVGARGGGGGAAPHAAQEPQADERGHADAHVAVEADPGEPEPGVGQPLGAHGGEDGEHALEHEGVGAEELAGDLAVAAGVGLGRAAPALAGVEGREEGHVVAGGVVGRQVGREEEHARRPGQ